MAEVLIGRVSHYYSKIGVAALDLQAPLHKGDRIRVQGHTSYMEGTADSLEIDHRRVDEASPGDAVDIKVLERVRKGDEVYRVT